ncbi:MAG: hypothetical protein NO474_02070 [Methanomassiliicoccales archaeon]|jgi:hypothetical protein|nr:hypothetical protein [Methanomassiliicoccales archaeon]
MEIPEYVSVREVKEICKKLGIRDWTLLKKPEVTVEEAEKILAAIDAAGLKVPVETFRKGLEVELEHGKRYQEANVTNNHPILTGKIVLAHLFETLDYYERLEVAEIEGDLLKALVNEDTAKVASLYEKLLKAKYELAEAESKALSERK